MKVVIVSVTILVIMIIAGYMFQSDIRTGSSEISADLINLKSAVEDKRWDDAAIIWEVTEDKWQHINRVWSVSVDHEELDKIYGHLRRLNEYMKFHDEEHCMAELVMADDLIKHIPKKESLSLLSVF